MFTFSKTFVHLKGVQTHTGQPGGGLVKDSGIEVCIVFSSFHWVRRESCRRLGHHHQDIPMYKHVQNVQGLQQLR